jgi:hypothetical protein
LTTSIIPKPLALSNPTASLPISNCTYYLYNLLFSEGCSGLSSSEKSENELSNNVNPITILVPNLKLDSNNCHFAQIVKLIEAIKWHGKEMVTASSSLANNVE